MISPYFQNGGGVSFQPPGGLAQMLALRDQENTDAFQTLGRFAGSAVSAGVGAYQGFHHPEVFGEGTGPVEGALNGGLLNFTKGYGGGAPEGGSRPSGFRSLTGGGGGAAETPNFKQLQALGKSADSFRDALKHGTPTVGDQEHDIFGTDDEWKTLSATEKFQRVQTSVQANAEKSVVQKLAAGKQALQQQQQQMQADQAFSYDARMNPLLSGQGPRRTTLANVQQAAVQNPTAPAAQNILQETARAEAVNKNGFFKPADAQKPLPNGYGRIVTGPNSAQIVPLPEAGGPLQAERGNYFFDGKRWVTAKDNEVPGAKVLSSFDRENASLRAQLIYMEGDEKAAALAQIKSNEASIAALRGGGKGTPATPKVGEVRKGYKFKGGDPANSKNWEAQ